MFRSTVVLVGFSTAGKSFYLQKIEKGYSNRFSFFDSDKSVSSAYDAHIFNIFMAIGREAAIDYIENKEEQFLRFVTKFTRKPQLIAAGPFLVIRSGWDKFIKKRNPFIIHLDKKSENVYNGLIERRQGHISRLDISNPNFGSWDQNIITQVHNGRYKEVLPEVGLANINAQLVLLNPLYQKYGDILFDSNELKSSIDRQQDLTYLIIQKLSETLS